MRRLTQASLTSSRLRSTVCTVPRTCPLFQQLYKGRIKKAGHIRRTRIWGWLSMRETSLEEVCRCSCLLNDCSMVPVGFLSKEILTLCLSQWLYLGEASCLHVVFSFSPSLLRASPPHPAPLLDVLESYLPWSLYLWHSLQTWIFKG